MSALAISVIAALATGILAFTGIMAWNRRDDLFAEHTGRHTAEAIAAAQLRALAPPRPEPGPAETAALAIMTGPEPPHSPDWPMHKAAEPVLERAARMLPPWFDPEVDSMVNGIKPVKP